eukprot:IDg23385t1
MDSDNSSFKIPKLRDDNFHSWKYRVELVLSVRDLLDYIHDDPLPPILPIFVLGLKATPKPEPSSALPFLMCISNESYTASRLNTCGNLCATYSKSTLCSTN